MPTAHLASAGSSPQSTHCLHLSLQAPALSYPLPSSDLSRNLPSHARSLLCPQQASVLTYPPLLSGLCRLLHSHTQCPTQVCADTQADMLMAHLSSQQASLFTCPQPQSVYSRHLHSHAHCYPVLCRFLHPHPTALSCSLQEHGVPCPLTHSALGGYLYSCFHCPI